MERGAEEKRGRSVKLDFFPSGRWREDGRVRGTSCLGEGEKGERGMDGDGIEGRQLRYERSELNERGKIN